MFISACFSDKSVQMNYSTGKNHAIIYCYDAWIGREGQNVPEF